MKLVFCVILFILSMPATLSAAVSSVAKTCEVAIDLYRQGKKAEALATLDSLHKSMNEDFGRQYDNQMITERIETRAEEAKVAAQRERKSLMTRTCILASVLFAGGFMIYLLVRRENKRIAQSAADMKEATDRAEMAEKSKSMFLSNMTHEIRAPLNAISGFADVLAYDDIDEEVRREAAEIIEMNSNMLQNLIDDVVDTACADLRDMKFRIVPCDIVKLGRNVTEMTNRIKKTNAAMSFETKADRLMVMVDPLRLQQVMVNVLVNATKFCKEGSIVMSVEEYDKGARVSVTDTGIGIPKEKQADVFGRYERVGETAEGFGLGLSICKFMIEHMGGNIWVDSEYTDGARFVFTAPFESPLTEEGGMA